VTQRQRIILGTRGSELAQAQARMVAQRLQTACPGLQVDVRIIKTQGDTSSAPIIDLRAGRKGLFTGEIERALIAREIDVAVHSAKDLPSQLTSETEIVAVLPRAATDDVLVLKKSSNLDSLPKNGTVATGSVRRKHQLLWQRPDLNIVDLRGNVPTRLQKLTREKWDAIVLARAGLERLGFNLNSMIMSFEGNNFLAQCLPSEIFLSAGGQGIIAIQARLGDDGLKPLVKKIDDSETKLCLRAEREFLRLLDADCNRPVGVLATVDGETMKTNAQIFDGDKPEPRTAAVEGAIDKPEKLAADLFQRIAQNKRGLS
jgi:hydroxymethylbilane synthase